MLFVVPGIAYSSIIGGEKGAYVSHENIFGFFSINKSETILIVTGLFCDNTIHFEG